MRSLAVVVTALLLLDGCHPCRALNDCPTDEVCTPEGSCAPSNSVDAGIDIPLIDDEQPCSDLAASFDPARAYFVGELRSHVAYAVASLDDVGSYFAPAAAPGFLHEAAILDDGRHVYLGRRRGSVNGERDLYVTVADTHRLGDDVNGDGPGPEDCVVDVDPAANDLVIATSCATGVTGVMATPGSFFYACGLQWFDDADAFVFDAEDTQPVAANGAGAFLVSTRDGVGVVIDESGLVVGDFGGRGWLAARVTAAGFRAVMATFVDDRVVLDLLDIGTDATATLIGTYRTDEAVFDVGARTYDTIGVGSGALVDGDVLFFGISAGTTTIENFFQRERYGIARISLDEAPTLVMNNTAPPDVESVSGQLLSGP